ncbi:MAG TPA: DUF1456 family protein [Desulfomicrobiaceae bacterium]|nr:DUF1456 family protein [Desulfomicrobiaceae bacterium]
MTNNDILRRLRYIEHLDNPNMLAVFGLSGLSVTETDLDDMLKREEEPGAMECPDKVLNAFLDGLITKRRGPRDDGPNRKGDLPLNNNLILRKLRIALELKDTDIIDIMQEVGTTVSKNEVSALFRKRDHRNFKACGDQFLRKFLSGLNTRAASKK